MSKKAVKYILKDMPEALVCLHFDNIHFLNVKHFATAEAAVTHLQQLGVKGDMQEEAWECEAERGGQVCGW